MDKLWKHIDEKMGIGNDRYYETWKLVVIEAPKTEKEILDIVRNYGDYREGSLFCAIARKSEIEEIQKTVAGSLMDYQKEFNGTIGIVAWYWKSH